VWAKLIYAFVLVAQEGSLLPAGWKWCLHISCHRMTWSSRTTLFLQEIYTGIWISPRIQLLEWCSGRELTTNVSYLLIYWTYLGMSTYNFQSFDIYLPQNPDEQDKIGCTWGSLLCGTILYNSFAVIMSDKKKSLQSHALSHHFPYLVIKWVIIQSFSCSNIKKCIKWKKKN